MNKTLQDILERMNALANKGVSDDKREVETVANQLHSLAVEAKLEWQRLKFAKGVMESYGLKTDKVEEAMVEVCKLAKKCLDIRRDFEERMLWM